MLEGRHHRLLLGGPGLLRVLELLHAVGELRSLLARRLGLLRELLEPLVDLRGLVAAQDHAELGGLGHEC